MNPGLVLIILLSWQVSAPSWAAERDFTSVVNESEALRKRWGVTAEYLKYAKLENVKIAVLANAPTQFKTPESAETLQYLPRGTRVFSGKELIEEEALTDWEGRRFAQVVFHLLGRPNPGPPLALYAIHSPSSFRDALASATEWGANLILCTVQFPYFGNFDGTGPLHTRLEEFVKTGGLWVQSTGAHHNRVVSAKIPDPGLERRLRFKILADETPFTLTLAWPGISTTGRKHGTHVDLDLFLYSENARGGLELLGKSDWKQTTGESNPEQRTTGLPAETISKTLDSSEKFFTVVVSNQTTNSLYREGASFYLTLTSTKKLFPDAVKGEFTDPLQWEKPSEKSLLPPADSLVAVRVGSTNPSDTRGADLIQTEAAVEFSDKVSLVGSDVAATQFAAVVALLKSQTTDATQAHFKTLVQRQNPEFSKSKDAIFLPPKQTWEQIVKP